jgi:hypothetical protein
MNIGSKYTHLDGKLITHRRYNTIKKQRNKNIPKLKWSKNFAYIYGLYSPILNKYFYVGISQNPRVRYYQHLRYDSSNSDKNNHIERLKLKNLAPRLDILAQVPVEYGLKWEREYIRYIQSIGHPLVNKSKEFNSQDLFKISDEDIEILSVLNDEEDISISKIDHINFLQNL